MSSREQTATNGDSLRITPTPLTERNHYIPEGALTSSEEVKHPPASKGIPKADVYSEERVSKDHPSKSDTRVSAPDDTMNPG